MYTIRYNYDTGDTFNTDCGIEDTVEFQWENLNEAKMALARIKQQYEWRDSLRSAYGEDPDPLPWKSELAQAFRLDPQHTYTRVTSWELQSYIPIHVNGKLKVLYTGTWTGFFESLNWARIERITPEDDGIEIRF